MLQRAAANPSAFAVIGPEGVCTYGEILRRAELFAAYLCDVQPTASRTSSQSMLPLDLENPLLEESILENHWNEENQFIGLMVAPGPWMLAGPLGAWMAGRGYFALDTSHPLERIQQMTQDASPQCVFTERKNQSLANSLGWPTVFVEDLAMQRREHRETNAGFDSCKNVLEKVIETGIEAACRHVDLYGTSIWIYMVLYSLKMIISLLNIPSGKLT